MLLGGEYVIGLLMLIWMEVALGIDNLIFIGLLTGDLSPAESRRVWRFWMVYSPLLRVILLLGLVQLLKASYPLLRLASKTLTLREILLLIGGLFLLYKAVREIHHRLEGTKDDGVAGQTRGRSFLSILGQVALVDLVFSTDSVLTAIGMAPTFWMMAVAVVVATALMLLAAASIRRFIQRHPTIKMLALAFLLLIGFALVGEGTGLHIPKGYLYFAMAFSLGVELLNIRAGMRAQGS
ncbi:MAG: TerC family protein [Bacteroidia bacterium]|nr:TerC family protein [Bacteroidia bacterium]MDW8014663.1 TerC family protein [Bacteroidia bacterium]